MALKTFNIDQDTYKKYSKHCKSRGMSMSKQIENFLKAEIEKLSTKTGDPEQKTIETEIITKEATKAFTLQKKEHPLMKYC